MESATVLIMMQRVSRCEFQTRRLMINPPSEPHLDGTLHRLADDAAAKLAAIRYPG